MRELVLGNLFTELLVRMYTSAGKWDFGVLTSSDKALFQAGSCITGKEPEGGCTGMTYILAGVTELIQFMCALMETGRCL